MEIVESKWSSCECHFDCTGAKYCTKSRLDPLNRGLIQKEAHGSICHLQIGQSRQMVTSDEKTITATSNSRGRQNLVFGEEHGKN